MAPEYAKATDGSFTKPGEGEWVIPNDVRETLAEHKKTPN
jgi:hypothetical protein